MIVCVLEYPEHDQADVLFVDMDETTNANYIKAIKKAIKDPDKMAEISYSDSVSYGATGIKMVKPPCKVSKSITLYIT